MKFTNVLLGSLILLGLGYGIGRYLQPTKVVTKNVEVVKEVEVIKKDIRTVVREIERPDGTKERETITEDKSRESSRTDSKSESTKEVIAIKPQWRVQGLAKLSELDEPVYGVGIERRIVGPIAAGIWANDNKEYGVSVSFEF